MGFVKLLPLLTTVVMVLGLPRKEELNYRLPDIYRPADYQVHLNLTADVFTESFSGYTGTVAINFTVTEDTREVKLHASKDDLQIQMVSISGIYLDVLDYNIENVTNILTINYPIGLVAGRYDVLSIQFSGNLSYDEDGFYKSTYKTDSGETRYLATTQFETASARRAFPCFDEPAFKATFDIYITYPVGYTAISNTPGTIVDSESASETIQFETTPVMSTYLLAFVISDFTAAKAVADDEVVHQLWSRNNTSNNRAWGLEMGQKMLAALNRFTGFNYSNVMKKMDQGAIPDFAAGAMENWGLVLYREGALLWNEDSSSNTEKQNVATTIAHEFSHQWFGDLVTMRWWSETFLNEGFATYCEFNVAHEVLPDYKLDEQFLVYVVHSVLLLDSYESEQALESEASTPEEVGQKFGVVSYNKGASIIRMVEHIMGTDNFRAGVHTYIENSKFDNAVPDDLWSALNQHVDNSLSDLPDELPVVMENWTVKSGLPLVHVSRSDSEITITQERLLLSGNDTSRKWYVPISYTTSEDEDKFTNTLPSGWLTPDSDLTITVPETASWVILNNKQTGYYRVNYDDDLWDSIAAGLLKEDFDGITELNRAQIVDDIFNLAMAEKIEYDRGLALLEFLGNDIALVPWMAAFNGLSYLLWQVDENSELWQNISSNFLRLMTKLYESAPASQPDPSNQVYSMTRVLAATWACKLGNQDCINYSLTNFASYKNEGAKLDNNLKYVICCNALRYGNDRSDYDFMLDVYNNSTDVEQWYLGAVLSCSPYSEVVGVLEQHLHRMISQELPVASQDIPSTLLDMIKKKPEVVDIALKFLMDNYDTLGKRYRHFQPLGDMLKTIATRLNKYHQVEQLEEIMESGNFPSGLRKAAKAAIEIANSNIQWKEKLEQKLEKYYGLRS